MPSGVSELAPVWKSLFTFSSPGVELVKILLFCVRINLLLYFMKSCNK